MEPSAYRQLQMDAVTGHAGSDVVEVQVVTSLMHLCVGILYTSWAAPRLPALGARRFLLEFGLIVMPQVVMFIYPGQLATILAALGGLFVLSAGLWAVRGPPRARPSQAEYFGQARLPFVSNYRATIMLLTVLCILAVDFAGFPRRWAKTEAFGTSLMDVGVGCIVFSSGMVAASHYGGDRAPSLLSAVRQALAMLLLGGARVVLVKLVGYQEHVSEYGVHWNFFITLALLPILLNGISRLVPVRRFAACGLALSVLFEGVLKRTRLEAFVLGGDRTGLLSMNKEGLCSMVGCLALFMISCGTGHIIQVSRSAKVKNRFKLLGLRLTVQWIVFWGLYYGAAQVAGLAPSRRLMNLSFVLWAAASNATHVLAQFLLDALFLTPPAQSSLLAAVNDNQLLLFLLANLGTGLVNQCCQTLLLSQAQAVAILTAYALALCGMAFVLKRRQLVLRLR